MLVAWRVGVLPGSGYVNRRRRTRHVAGRERWQSDGKERVLRVVLVDSKEQLVAGEVVVGGVVVLVLAVTIEEIGLSGVAPMVALRGGNGGADWRRLDTRAT